MSKGKKAKVFHETRCQEHGKMRTNKDTRSKSVAGSPPNHKRGLHSGCPVCKAQKSND